MNGGMIIHVLRCPLRHVIEQTNEPILPPVHRMRRARHWHNLVQKVDMHLLSDLVADDPGHEQDARVAIGSNEIGSCTHDVAQLLKLACSQHEEIVRPPEQVWEPPWMLLFNARHL